jgi:RimJ/RimL family protein N-acetyltransferase
MPVLTDTSDAFEYGQVHGPGHLGLFGARPKDRCATIGIGLGREYVGMGYGTDAMRVSVASFHDGRWYDELLMGLLADDWAGSAAAG